MFLSSFDWLFTTWELDHIVSQQFPEVFFPKICLCCLQRLFQSKIYLHF
ncbi:hypothetical protein Hanom_Chr11g01061901 [Helianthus anomalus]